MAGSLDGVRVLDLAGGSFGYAGRLLAGLGAEVIKVEPPGGDALRRWPPFPSDQPDPETGARHLHLDAAKQSVVVDLDQPEGCDLLRRLVSEADVVLESFAPRYLAERDLDYDRLIEVRPDLVMASVTHFGQDGPYAGYLGGEIVDLALGGYLKLTGDADREPVKPYDDLILQHAALHATVAVMGGLMRRDATGEGDHFDVCVMEAALTLGGGALQMYHANGHMHQRTGARLLSANPRYAYPSTIRPCRDGYVHAHSNNRHIDLLAVLMPGLGLEALLETPMANADAIDEAMDQWLADKDKTEAVRLAQELRLPFTEVFTPDEILSDPHLEERGFLVDLRHPEAPEGLKQPGAAATMTATSWRAERAPILGEHTEAILTDLLGMEAGDIEALRASGAVA
ncbi:MAG: hypothetical protein GEU80_06170 [Dehalococcoidia bacterium]|nr:hypothetical protein [Dehalococcoidia bacterium]